MITFNKSNKILLSIVIGLIPLLLKSEIKEVTTCGSAMTISLIRIRPYHNYYKLLMVGHPIGESINVSALDSLPAFVDSIVKQTTYISSNSITFTYGVYQTYWSRNEQLYEAGDKFMYEFDDKVNEFGQTIEFKLKDKTRIEITYLDVYGFFIYGDKIALFPFGHSSDSIDYMKNKDINNIWFLMSVVCYNKTASNPFIFPTTS